MTIAKDLKALQNNFKALEKKMEKLIATAEKSEKPKVAKKTTTKSVKAKTTKKGSRQKRLLQKRKPHNRRQLIKC